MRPFDIDEKRSRVLSLLVDPLPFTLSENTGLLLSPSELSNEQEAVQEVVDWLNDNPQSLASKLLGYFGYGIGLFSSVYMIFLGDDFARRLGIHSKAGAYVLSSISALPLTFLLAGSSKRTFSLLVPSKSQRRDELINPVEQRCLYLDINRKLSFIFLGCTSSLLLTYLSHEKFIQITTILAVTILFDVLCFLPRVFLVYASLNVFYKLMMGYVKGLKASFEEKPRDSESIAKAQLSGILNKSLAVIEQLSDTEVELFYSKHIRTPDGKFDKNSLESILKLGFMYPELSRPRHILVNFLIELLALGVAFGGSYFMVPTGYAAYPQIFVFIHVVSNFLGPTLSWLGCLTFTTVLRTAITVSFTRFYQTGQRTIRRISIRENLSSGDDTDVDCISWTRQNVLPIVTLIFTACLTTLSCFPRIEINDEQIKGITGILLTVLNVLTGICFFSLDFWPLSMISKAFSKIDGHREQMTKPVLMINQILPHLKQSYVMGLFNLTKKPGADELIFNSNSFKR